MKFLIISIAALLSSSVTGYAAPNANPALAAAELGKRNLALLPQPSLAARDLLKRQAPSPTTTTTSSPIQCPDQCGQIHSAFASCSDDACICSTILPSASACGSCLAGVNITAAGVLSQDVSVCLQSVAVTGLTTSASAVRTVRTVTTPTGAPCTSECAPVISAASTCKEDNCFCPVMLNGAGNKCSDCYMSYNATVASYWGLAIKTCLDEINSGLITARPTGSNAALVSRSGAGGERLAGEKFGMGVMLLMGIGVITGLITLVM